jgi:predicted RNA-binding Zn-ribbon protein involved in translation (DUF1610 family)
MMSEPTQNVTKANVNVTLGAEGEQSARHFPCPLCGIGLDLRQSRAHKPYCVCNSCGLQIFFRAKSGISRLRALLVETGSATTTTTAISAFSRIQQLRAQKRELEQKRQLFHKDESLEHAILAVAREISRLESVLDEMSEPRAKQERRDREMTHLLSPGAKTYFPRTRTRFEISNNSNSLKDARATGIGGRL